MSSGCGLCGLCTWSKVSTQGCKQPAKPSPLPSQLGLLSFLHCFTAPLHFIFAHLLPSPPHLPCRLDTFPQSCSFPGTLPPVKVSIAALDPYTPLDPYTHPYVCRLLSVSVGCAACPRSACVRAARWKWLWLWLRRPRHLLLRPQGRWGQVCRARAQKPPSCGSQRASKRARQTQRRGRTCCACMCAGGKTWLKVCAMSFAL